MKKENSEIDIEKIIQKYRPMITFRVKKAIGHHYPEWEDVVNEIIVHLIKNLKNKKFKGNSTIGTFIYTITSRRITDYIRKKSRFPKFAPEPNPSPDPCDQVENKEKSELLVEAIKNLDPKYKNVLYFYYYKEFPRDQVAQKLGITPSQVSERVNYAQKLIKKMIKK